jgi:type I restriction enzyme M protein
MTHESGVAKTISFTLSPEDSFVKVYEKSVKAAFADEIKVATKDIGDTRVRNKAIKGFIKALQTDVEYTHRHYIKDDEYIPYGEDIEAFLEREIKKPIICWADAPQLGYEILPNKYFYQYKPPKPADDLLNDFWALEKEAEGILVGLAT